MYRLFLFCLALPLFITSCGPTYIFESTHEIPEESWTYADRLEFGIDIEDTLKIYNLYLDIEHSKAFKYQNLYTRINTRFPGGAEIKEVLSLELQHKSGIWLGDCSSTYCTLRIPIQEGAYFNARGKHTIFIEQFMRKNSISGVKSIGLKVEDTGQNR